MQKDITIIGAGSTGLSAGIFLEASGYKPTIYEKRERAKITKAIGINPVTLQLFEKSGITNRFLQNGWKVECMNFWYKDDLVYKNHFSKVRHPFPYMVIQPQHETEAILEEYLAEKGVFVKRSFDLEHLKQQENNTSLVFKNLSTNKSHKIETDGIILGADGNKSKVREEIGVAFKGWEHPAEFKLYDIELETPLTHKEGHYRFYREGGMLMLHIRDGVWRVGGNLENVLEYLPKGTKTGKISWETTFTIREMLAEQYSVGNVHLLGDAAHIHSPLGGKGMNMCIEDSYVFTQLLLQNKVNEYSKIRRKKVKSSVGILGQLTEVVGGKHFIGNTLRSSMNNFSFLFPVFMPYIRKFLLGLK